MKTATKTKIGKTAGLALAAAMLVSAIPAGVLGASAYGKSEEVAKANDNVLTSNLIQDGSFEGVSVNADTTKAGAWDIDITSSAAGKGGSVAIVDDGYTGSKALQLHAESNKSGYPEISQKISVLPNTTYYVSLRVRVGYVNNIFFGLASAERENETIYGQLHRWGDTSIDKDHDVKEDRITLVNPDDSSDSDEYSAYSLYNGHFTTGNETDCRLFIRVEKSAIVIDDVSVTYEGNLLPAGASNLLSNGGFEDSNKATPLAGGWETISDTATQGSEIGIDPLDTATYMRSTQDKQMEGLNTLYLAAKSGFTTEDNITIGQPVTVKANTNYTFSVNLSKYGDAKRAADEENNVTAQGIQKVTVGVYAADKSTVLKATQVDGSNISMARYNMVGVYANSGENTTVYPFIKFEAVDGGQWGNCLYVDDCLFYENVFDLPAEKTNLLENGDFAAGNDGSDGWDIVNGWAESKQGYLSSNNLGVNQWYPYVGIMQSTKLEAGKWYKVTAYIESWVNLPSPASILVIEGNAKNASKIMNDGISLWNGGAADEAYAKYAELNVVAKQSTFVPSDMFYRPVNLIFSVPSTGVYTVCVGFDEPAEAGKDGNLIFIGGVNLGGISMYETSMEELSPSKEVTPIDIMGCNDPTNITLSESGITVAKGTTVAHFAENSYGYGDYKVKVLDASGNAVTTGEMKAEYKVLVYTEGDEANGYRFAVTVSDKAFEGGNGGNEPGQPEKPGEQEPEQPKGGCGTIGFVGGAGGIGGGIALGVVALATMAVVFSRKKANNK